MVLFCEVLNSILGPVKSAKRALGPASLVALGTVVHMDLRLAQLPVKLCQELQLALDCSDLLCEQRLQSVFDAGACTGVRKVQEMADLRQLKAELFSGRDEIQSLKMAFVKLPIPV